MYVTGTCIFVSSFRMQLPYPTRSAEPDTPSARPRISLSRLQIPVRTGSKITDMSHDMEGGMFVHAAVEIRKHRGRNTGTTVFLDSFCPTMVPVRVSRVYPECVQAPPGVFLPVPPVSFYRTGTGNRYRYARKSSESLSSSECFHSPLVWPRGLPRCASRRELPFSFLW